MNINENSPNNLTKNNNVITNYIQKNFNYFCNENGSFHPVSSINPVSFRIDDFEIKIESIRKTKCCYSSNNCLIY